MVFSSSNVEVVDEAPIHKFGLVLCLLLIATIGALTYSLYKDHRHHIAQKSHVAGSPQISSFSFVLSGDFVSGMLSAMVFVLTAYFVCDYGATVLAKHY